MKFDELVRALGAAPMNGAFAPLPGGYTVPEVTLARLRLLADVTFVRRSSSFLIVRMSVDEGLANLIAPPDPRDRLRDGWLFLTDK